jgi:hypothetical protein
LVEQKTDKPQKGEFIDLNSGEFKKKSNLGKIFIKYFLVSVIFFSFGFLGYEPIKNHLSNPKPYEKDEEDKIDNTIEQEQQGRNFDEKFDGYDKQFESIFKIINENKQKFDKFEENNKEFKNQLNNINDNYQNLLQYDLEESYLLDFKKNRVLINFLILKTNFNNRKNFGDEIEILRNLFIKNLPVLEYLDFFRSLDLERIKTNEFLLNEINQTIFLYENDINDLFDEIENDPLIKNENIFSSKEDFINYIKDIFHATFKVTRYEKDTITENENNMKPIRKILTLAKESLLVDDIDQSIKILQDSNINNEFLVTWINKANQLKEAKDNLIKLEMKILELLGYGFD